MEDKHYKNVRLKLHFWAFLYSTNISLRLFKVTEDFKSAEICPHPLNILHMVLFSSSLYWFEMNFPQIHRRMWQQEYPTWHLRRSRLLVVMIMDGVYWAREMTLLQGFRGSQPSYPPVEIPKANQLRKPENTVVQCNPRGVISIISANESSERGKRDVSEKAAWKQMTV